MFKQRGVALIIVLLVVAIVSVLATEMGGRLQLQMRRAQNIKDNNQAYWYAMGAEEFARKSIATLIAESNGVISLSQPWATNDFTFPVAGGSISAKLVDMQSCFNLNSVAEVAGQKFLSTTKYSNLVLVVVETKHIRAVFSRAKFSVFGSNLVSSRSRSPILSHQLRNNGG